MKRWKKRCSECYRGDGGLENRISSKVEVSHIYVFKNARFSIQCDGWSQGRDILRYQSSSCVDFFIYLL